MVALLQSFFALTAILARIWINIRASRQRKQKENLEEKSSSYEKLKKAFEARHSARVRNSVSKRLPNDAYRGETSSGWECSAFLPISWSADDTHETVEQIIEHNAVWDSMCMMK